MSQRERGRMTPTIAEDHDADHVGYNCSSLLFAYQENRFAKEDRKDKR